MLKSLLPAALLLASALVLPARGQVYQTVYRPPEARYFEVSSPHFRVIYEQGLEQEARETAAILEARLPEVRALVDQRRPLRMPVVLNRFNDRANGYVTAVPFKQEVEGVSIKGERLSPRFPSWLAAVLPHELVHAVHAESGRGVGVGWLTRPFAPDLSRATNFQVPSGFAEGIAVYYESMLHEGAGRLQFPLFNMAFRAAMLSDDPWSLTQMLEEPAFTRPRDRHYNGGGHFFAYMADRDRLGFFSRTRDLVYRMPYLGFGLPLWVATGDTPRRLGADVRKASRAAAAAAIAELGPLTDLEVVSSAEGLVHHRPRWLNDSTILVHARGYRTRPGFYSVDAGSGRMRPVSYQNLTEDHYYSLDRADSTVLFSRYVTDRHAPLKAIAESFALHLTTRRVSRLTTAGRTMAPVPARGGGIWALRNDGQFNDWVHVASGGATSQLTDYERSFFKMIAPPPDDGSLAVLLNVRGRQGIFRADVGDDGVELSPWLMFEDGTIYDVHWGPRGRYLLFSADPGGTSNIYAYDHEERRLLKLTNVPFGALEPALSPDGSTLAFINYRHERYDLVTLPFDASVAQEVALSTAAYGDELPWRKWLDGAAAENVRLTDVRRYRSWRNLRPRMLYPVVKEAPGAADVSESLDGLGVGLAAEGTDPLERWAFRAESYRQRGAFWGELQISSAATVVRPFARLYAAPSRVSVGPHTLDRDERGASLGIRFPLVLSSNVFRTQTNLYLQGKYRETRLRGFDDEPLHEYRGHLTIQSGARLAYRLQTNMRDLVPNSGAVLSLRGATDAWAESGSRVHWLNPRLDLYLPLLRQRNVGIHVFGSVIAQSRGGILDLTTFVPRGHDTPGLGRGVFTRFGAELTQPLWYVDDGSLLIPLYFEALYAFGYGELLRTLRHEGAAVSQSSAGAGLGLRFRLLHVLDLHLKMSAAYRIQGGGWRIVAR